MAAYGLGALVLGGAAAVATKKGFWALLVSLFAAGWKLIAGLARLARNKAISMSRSAWRRRRHETLAAALIPAWTCEEDRPPVERVEVGFDLTEN